MQFLIVLRLGSLVQFSPVFRISRLWRSNRLDDSVFVEITLSFVLDLFGK